MKRIKIYLLLTQEKVEIWKKIKGYEDYEVSNLGRVKSHKLPQEKILKTNLRNGYESVELRNSLGRKRANIHRLMCIMFFGEEGMVVNHKDGCKTNNILTNLEWCTISENTKHAYDNGLIEITDPMREARRKNIKIASQAQYKKVECIETGKIYDSLTQAVLDVGLKGSSSIIRACKNHNKKAGGYHWRYVN